MGTPDNIVGYVDPLICYPGDKPAVKISCGRGKFSSQVFRLRAGYSHPDAPPVNHEVVEGIPKEWHEGKPQYSRPGSYAVIDRWDSAMLDGVEWVKIAFWCYPTLPEGAGHEQYLFSSFDAESNVGFECFLNESGNLIFCVGGDGEVQKVTLSQKLERHRWYHLKFDLKAESCILSLRTDVQARDISEETVFHAEEHQLRQQPRVASHKPIIIASDSLSSGPFPRPTKSATFNGKIGDFIISAPIQRQQISIAQTFCSAIYQPRGHGFEDYMPIDKIHGPWIGHNSLREEKGTLVNSPSRAVTSHDWDPRQPDWTRAGHGYDAIHYHDDDLDDAMWNITFELDLPHDLRSGCYGVFVDDGESTDFIPFFVRPDPQAADTPPVALIMPTFTYAGQSLPLHKPHVPV